VYTAAHRGAKMEILDNKDGRRSREFARGSARRAVSDSQGGGAGTVVPDLQNGGVENAVRSISCWDRLRTAGRLGARGAVPLADPPAGVALRRDGGHGTVGTGQPASSIRPEDVAEAVTDLQKGVGDGRSLC
jgi:hypothetical protein